MNKVEKCGEQLKDPMLLINIIDEVQKEGVVGEEDSIMSLVMKIMLRYVRDADKTSSNIVISDKSGGGKDYLVECVSEVMLPKTDYYHRTGLSEKIFSYWNANKKDFTWNGKVIHLEDPDDDLIQSQGFRVMASGGSRVTVVKDQQAVDLKVNGKPVIIVTSLNADIDTEGIRRWDTIRMDTGEELTKAVIKHRMLKKAGLIDYKPNKNLREGLKSLLHPVDVKIPFIEDILTIFPSMLAMRTIGGKFVDYIKASTILHQFQREKNEDGSINATWIDYEYARFVFTKLVGMYGVPLNRTEEGLMQILIDAGSCRDAALSIKEISTRFDHSMSWLYRNLKNKDKFKTTGLIKEVLEFDEQSNKEITKYYTEVQMKRMELPPAGFFTDFHQIFTPQQISFSVLSVFQDYESFIYKRRMKNGISPEYTPNSYTFKKTEKTGSRTASQQERMVFANKMTKPEKTMKKPELSLFDRINELSKFIKENKNAGFAITKEMLTEKFDDKFIDLCLDNGTLCKVNNEYAVRYQ